MDEEFELPMDDLERAARAVRENAHAPYSGFRVGAALRSASGRIHAGCNVENVAYPEGTCAEAGAIAAMVAAGEREIVEVLVIADSPAPVPPCGGCRQKLAEFAPPLTPVVMATTAGERRETTVGALLPGAFGSAHMAGAAAPATGGHDSPGGSADTAGDRPRQSGQES